MISSYLKGTKQWWQPQLHVKDLGKLQYFLWIVVSRNKHGILMSQSKYVADLLEETGCTKQKAVDTPLEVSIKLEPQVGEWLKKQGKYRRIVGNLYISQ